MDHITTLDYFMGRQSKWPHEFTDLVRANAAELLKRVNRFVGYAIEGGHFHLETHPVHGGPLSSGWRPAEINAHTKGAAVRSKHMTGQACDVYDPDGDLDEFALTDVGQKCLEVCGLYLEHPSATKGWCHLQSVPPRSGRRVFYP